MRLGAIARLQTQHAVVIVVKERLTIDRDVYPFFATNLLVLISAVMFLAARCEVDRAIDLKQRRILVSSN